MKKKHTIKLKWIINMALILFFIIFILLLDRNDRLKEANIICLNNTITDYAQNYKYIECNNIKYKIQCDKIERIDKWSRTYYETECSYKPIRS